MLAAIDLAIDDGETVGLVGPSGSGKTTLLSIIGLLQIPSLGEVRLDGDAIASHGRARSMLRAAEFAWIFQTVNVLGRRSSLDNVALGQLPKMMNRRDANMYASIALDRVGLGALKARQARLLSGGELQRVCIARAMAANPRFVFADEPTGQLDRSTSEVVIDALLSARPANTSIVLATHDPDVARRCDRVLELRDARVVER